MSMTEFEAGEYYPESHDWKSSEERLIPAADYLHVYAIPAHETGLDDPILIGTANTLNEAIALVRDAGYKVIEEGNGGNYDHYDAQDAPGVYGYAPDGKGAYGITVSPERA